MSNTETESGYVPDVDKENEGGEMKASPELAEVAGHDEKPAEAGETVSNAQKVEDAKPAAIAEAASAAESATNEDKEMPTMEMEASKPVAKAADVEKPGFWAKLFGKKNKAEEDKAA